MALGIDLAPEGSALVKLCFQGLPLLVILEASHLFLYLCSSLLLLSVFLFFTRRFLVVASVEEGLLFAQLERLFATFVDVLAHKAVGDAI